MGILAFHFGKMRFTFFQPHGPAPLPLTRKISARKAAPAPALAARMATAQAVPYVAVAAAASPATASSATPASVASPRGNSGIRDAVVRRPPETVSYTAGPVDMNDVRVKIRKIVREGFNLSGSSLLFSMVSGRSGMVWQGTNGFGQGTVSAVPLSGQYECGLLSPEGRCCFYLAAEIE